MSNSSISEFGPCGKHPRKIVETPSQAWYRAYESEHADKDPAQHCPECDRLAAAPQTGKGPDAPSAFAGLGDETVAEFDAAEHMSADWKAGYKQGAKLYHKGFTDGARHEEARLKAAAREQGNESGAK